MDENLKRLRERKNGGNYLLTGLMICGVCGSAYCSRRNGGGKYFYYRCIGTDKYRREGSAICDNSSVKGNEVESLVWSDVCKLLRDPTRLRSEMERRRDEPNATSDQLKGLEKTVGDLRSRLDRLIDGYESGLLQRHEFEQRIGPLRERHNREQDALASLRGQASDTMDVDSASAALSSLASSVATRLDEADWQLKRDLPSWTLSPQAHLALPQ